MNTTNTKPAQNNKVEEGWVQIDYWQNPRRIKIDETHIALEVTHAGCSHCPTCQKRVRDFMRTLARKPNIEHSWGWRNESNWLILPRPRNKDPLGYLQETLDLKSICFE